MSLKTAPGSPRRRWTLRRRLVLGIIALLAFVSIVIGTVSVLALQSSLMTQLDSQVTEAADRNQQTDRPGFLGGTVPADPIDGIPRFGLQPGSIAARITSSGTAAVLIGGSITSTVDTGPQLIVTDLTDDQKTRLAALPADGTATTVDFGGDLGSYRLSAALTRTGDIVIVGLPLASVTSTVTELVLVVVGVTLAGLAVAFLVGTAVVRVALRPLERVTATASHVAELPLESGDVALEARVADDDADPRTEVGQVGAAINRMLGHIAAALTARESSEKKLRTFVADASHELRTPLASIRGYAELTRRGGHDLPPDVVHALGRVESESVRMTSLVEDLLLLARLDDGRSLESKPVDLTRILTDTLSDAHAASQDHDWLFEAPDEPVVVPGDAARLHQVVVNLLANARVHTPAGTQVIASVRPVVGEPRVAITVTDNGPGIDLAVLPAVFERFARGDSSRSRTAGSTGLGLAIVAAIVDAHGGAVSVDSVPGETTFTVTLPA